jgi:hypothetical protein
MPTLVDVEITVPRQPAQLDEDSDASETILYDDSVDLIHGELGGDTVEPLNEPGLPSLSHPPPRMLTDRATNMSQNHSAPRGGQVDHDPMIDESMTILSTSNLLVDDTLDEIDNEVSPQEANGPPGRESQDKPHTTTCSSPSGRMSRRDDDGPSVGRRKPRILATIIGPNEQIYRSKYEKVVKTTIRDFDRNNPGKLRNYRSLPLEEQAKEQQRVLQVLSRLGIGKGSQRQPEHTHTIASQRHAPTSQRNQQSPSSMPMLDRERLLNDTMSPLMSPSCHGPPQMDEDNSFGVPDNNYDDDDDDGDNNNDSKVSTTSRSAADFELSRILLSPPVAPRLQQDEERPNSPCDHSSESVEIARAAIERSPYSTTGYGSPVDLKTTNPYKRQASASAKRGADLYRTKYNEDVVPPRPDDASVSEHTMDEALSARMERLSISPVKPGPKSFFAASQSPISPKLTYGSSSSSSDSEEDSLLEGKKNSTRRGESSTGISRFCDETIDTSTTTLDKTRRRAMREIPVNVGMKKGATFHLEKLAVKRSELTILKNGIGGPRRRLVNFPDPLTKYNSSQKKVLGDVFELIFRSELDSKEQTIVETTSANVLFSLSYEQIMDLCLKLFLNDEEEKSRYDDRVVQNSVSMQGRTVIVTRAKDDAAMWERALREGTGTSVFNHATAPLSDRVRLSTAEKVAKFDIVLTTYDALKASDIAIPVDDLGHAVISKPKAESGWMASRTTTPASSSQSAESDARPQKCKQLSVLHKVNFRRVIFADVLGRKSFLAKNGTARATASTALRANSR